jgi:Post-segregation antitoxin (ccd killing mechanism protein) encoded by the F plasmid
MLSLYDRNAPKKPTNLTVNSDLLSQAKSFHINISSVLESALEEKLKQRKKEEWLIENTESISAYNKNVEKIGVFSDGLRNF